MAQPLQRYNVIERLDAGGMAEVFKGKATSIQGIEKLVAIKRILPSLTKHKKFVSMFLDEARLSMHLSHANIVQVFDLGVADNTYFIVMEYVEGTNLRVIAEAARKTGYRIPVPHSIYLMMEVCKALGYAHTKKDGNGRPLGIVHRDVSPPNILLSLEGEVKLTDFGLAKAQSQLENTEPGVVKGKFSYLSPESAYGEEVDHRSDIFACGIILWELLAAQRLFLGATDLETLERVRRCQVPSVIPHNPEVAPELDAILQRALARKPQDRFSSAQEMGDQLAHYIFSRSLKVTSYDLSQLVQLVTSGKLGELPRPSQPLTLIDRLIQGELDGFHSIQGSSSARPLPEAYDGSRPLSLADLSVGRLGGSLPATSFPVAAREPEDRTTPDGFGLVRGSPATPAPSGPRPGASTAAGPDPGPAPVLLPSPSTPAIPGAAALRRPARKDRSGVRPVPGEPGDAARPPAASPVASPVAAPAVAGEPAAAGESAASGSRTGLLVGLLVVLLLLLLAGLGTVWYLTAGRGPTG
ncbi:MAG: protein kinase [Myxococcota bacterium]|jgi:serine/threonine-protein kinase|nr:protein kinase [Myxococcota bacterium]